MFLYGSEYTKNHLKILNLLLKKCLKKQKINFLILQLLELRINADMKTSSLFYFQAWKYFQITMFLDAEYFLLCTYFASIKVNSIRQNYIYVNYIYFISNGVKIN